VLSVGITALKNKLGKYVRLAARGETVLITNRGRVVAQFVPPRQPAARRDEPMKESERDREDR
jgi:prevent-host-death family protein